MTSFQNLAGRFKTGTSNPSSPVEGDMWYDTTNNRLMRYDGTNWKGVQMVTTSTSTTTTTSTSTSTTTT